GVVGQGEHQAESPRRLVAVVLQEGIAEVVLADDLPAPLGALRRDGHEGRAEGGHVGAAWGALASYRARRAVSRSWSVIGHPPSLGRGGTAARPEPRRRAGGSSRSGRRR